MLLVETFIIAQNFDIICLSKTILDSAIDIRDTENLRADHPSSTKCGGVCMYYKDYLPLIKRTVLSIL